jgi:hypothetical protein
MQWKIKFALSLLLTFCLSGCDSAAQTEVRQSADVNSSQPSPTATPPPFQSKNPRAIQAAQLLTKGELQANSTDKCQRFNQNDVENFKTRVKTYRLKFQGGQKSLMIEDYSTNNDADNKRASNIDESILNEYVLSARAGQKMTLEVLPAMRKDVEDFSGSLFLSIYNPNCENLKEIDLVRKEQRAFTLMLPDTGDYLISAEVLGVPQTFYRLKVTVQ